jgi:hypothetical protein
MEEEEEILEMVERQRRRKRKEGWEVWLDQSASPILLFVLFFISSSPHLLISYFLLSFPSCSSCPSWLFFVPFVAIQS